ncbi:MAG: histidine--tRNA ligase, partial [Actinobacteria bacterium]|nr:histidine--tRNA ligase [Actinomycetota bacterium]
KEMYTFEDRGGRSITLRPEGTVGALRSVIEHGLDKGSLPAKFYYSGAYFRAERPQAGRYRQFYSVGIEAIGSDDPALDAEIIAIADAGFRAIGLKQFHLEITSLGDRDSRAAHRIDLQKFISSLTLDDATKVRAELNPLRLFDDKRDEIRSAMKDAPVLLDYLSQASREHFEEVQGYLTTLGISYAINPKMVRGLDYYTGTTFEFVHDLLGAQSGIGGGGRYDGLMQEIGGASLTGIGFGLGVDRALLAAEAEGVVNLEAFTTDIYVIPIGFRAKSAALRLSHELRPHKLTVEVAFGDRSVKSAMKVADKSGARYVIVIGDEELESGSVEIKEMSTGDVTSVTLTSLVSTLSLK